MSQTLHFMLEDLPTLYEDGREVGYVIEKEKLIQMVSLLDRYRAALSISTPPSALERLAQVLPIRRAS